jgi:hypothetical protein
MLVFSRLQDLLNFFSLRLCRMLILSISKDARIIFINIYIVVIKISFAKMVHVFLPKIMRPAQVT